MMNEFFIASSRSVYIKINELEIEIKQVLIKDLDSFIIHASFLKDYLKKDYSIDDLKELLKENLTQTCPVFLLCTDLNIESLLTVLEDTDASAGLLHEIIKANELYFIDQKKDAKTTNQGIQFKKKNNATWFDSFQFLISNGHTHSEIMNMSYSAFMMYLDSAQKAHKKKMQAIATATRMAQHATANDFKKFMND